MSFYARIVYYNIVIFLITCVAINLLPRTSLFIHEGIELMASLHNFTFFYHVGKKDIFAMERNVSRMHFQSRNYKVIALEWSISNSELGYYRLLF